MEEATKTDFAQMGDFIIRNNWDGTLTITYVGKPNKVIAVVPSSGNKISITTIEN